MTILTAIAIGFRSIVLLQARSCFRGPSPWTATILWDFFPKTLFGNLFPYLELVQFLIIAVL
jgi:hypothetical protein